MSQLTAKLLAAGEQHRGTDLGGLLQWAALHIGSQDEALADVREEYERELTERQRLEQAAHAAKAAIESALAAVTATIHQPIELGRDFVPHINLMAAHGDPDYLKNNGNSIRHVDCRSAKPRKTGTKVPNAKSQATDAALSRQVACTDGLGVAVPPAPTFENRKD